MPLDYGIVKYVEHVGDHLWIHYADGKKVLAASDGRQRYVPQKTTTGAPPPYDPWTPPEDTGDPGVPGEWYRNFAQGFTLTSGFGYRSGGFHYGIDLSSTTAPTGLPIRAVADMVVTVAVDAYEGGNVTAGTYVKGHTPDGAYTFTYNHMADQSLAVSVGQTVTAGTQIGVEGATGNVTGTHLHFEIILGNWDNPWAPPYNNGAQFVDPLPILRDHGVLI